MLTATAHGRLGRDTELRYTADGQAVAELAIACDYGKKGQDGKKPTQWIRASLWGKQAEALAPYLLKGVGLVATLRDVHVREYEGKNGTGHSLEGTVINIEFAVGQPAQQEQQRAPAPAPRQQRPAPAPQSRGSSGFDDLDDDIPF